MRATIKGRLYGEAFCEPKHLAPKRQFIFDPRYIEKGLHQRAQGKGKAAAASGV